MNQTSQASVSQLNTLSLPRAYVLVPSTSASMNSTGAVTTAQAVPNLQTVMSLQGPRPAVMQVSHLPQPAMGSLQQTGVAVTCPSPASVTLQAASPAGQRTTRTTLPVIFKPANLSSGPQSGANSPSVGIYKQVSVVQPGISQGLPLLLTSGGLSTILQSVSTSQSTGLRGGQLATVQQSVTPARHVVQTAGGLTHSQRSGHGSPLVRFQGQLVTIHQGVAPVKSFLQTTGVLTNSHQSGRQSIGFHEQLGTVRQGATPVKSVFVTTGGLSTSQPSGRGSLPGGSRGQASTSSQQKVPVLLRATSQLRTQLTKCSQQAVPRLQTSHSQQSAPIPAAASTVSPADLHVHQELLDFLDDFESGTQDGVPEVPEALLKPPPGQLRKEEKPTRPKLRGKLNRRPKAASGSSTTASPQRLGKSFSPEINPASPQVAVPQTLQDVVKVDDHNYCQLVDALPYCSIDPEVEAILEMPMTASEKICLSNEVSRLESAVSSDSFGDASTSSLDDRVTVASSSGQLSPVLAEGLNSAFVSEVRSALQAVEEAQKSMHGAGISNDESASSLDGSMTAIRSFKEVSPVLAKEQNSAFMSRIGSALEALEEAQKSFHASDISKVESAPSSEDRTTVLSPSEQVGPVLAEGQNSTFIPEVGSAFEALEEPQKSVHASSSLNAYPPFVSDRPFSEQPGGAEEDATKPRRNLQLHTKNSLRSGNHTPAENHKFFLEEKSLPFSDSLGLGKLVAKSSPAEPLTKRTDPKFSSTMESLRSKSCGALSRNVNLPFRKAPSSKALRRGSSPNQHPKSAWRSWSKSSGSKSASPHAAMPKGPASPLVGFVQVPNSTRTLLKPEPQARSPTGPPPNHPWKALVRSESYCHTPKLQNRSSALSVARVERKSFTSPCYTPAYIPHSEIYRDSDPLNLMCDDDTLDPSTRLPQHLHVKVDYNPVGENEPKPASQAPEKAEKSVSKIPESYRALALPVIKSDHTQILSKSAGICRSDVVTQDMSPIRESENVINKLPRYHQDLYQSTKYDGQSFPSEASEPSSKSPVASRGRHHHSNSSSPTSDDHGRRGKRRSDSNSRSRSSSRSRSPHSHQPRHKRRRYEYVDVDHDADKERKVVFIEKLPAKCNSKLLRQHFSEFGQVTKVQTYDRCRHDRDDHAFVTFRYGCDAVVAIQEGQKGLFKNSRIGYGERRKFVGEEWTDLDRKTEMEEETNSYLRSMQEKHENWEAMLKSCLQEKNIPPP